MRLLRVLLAVGYPFLILAGLHWLEPRRLALLLGASVALRVLARRRPGGMDLGRLRGPALVVCAALAFTLVSNDPVALLFAPALMNAALLFSFARSLRAGPPLVETIARLQHPDLTDAQVAHCRTVTRVWCVFFALNGSVCLALALAGDVWRWTLYTGFVSYLLMGGLFTVEYIVRSLRFRQGTAIEPLFQRLFPQGRGS